MLIQTAHDTIRRTVRKSLGSYVSPEDIDRNINRGLNDYVQFLLRPNANTNIQPLTRYIKRREYNGISESSHNLPDDFLKEINIYSKADDTEYEGEILKEQEFTDRRNNYITPPDTEHPIARLLGVSNNFTNGEIQILPVQGNYVLTYYRNIVNCKYAYTSPDNRKIIFDEANSIDVDCNESALSEVISRALMYFGITMEAQNLVSEEQLKNGNA